MKALDRLVARFANSGTARKETAASAATRAASPDAEGTRAPSRRTGAPSRPRKRLALAAATALLASLVLGVTLAAATAPTVSIEPASEIAATSAKASGHVDPADHETTYHFEYITDAAFQAKDEQQQLTVSATAGTYTLTFAAQTTAPIAFDATASQVEAALNALPTIGGAGGSVTVSGGPGDEAGSAPYAITFGAALAATDVEQISSDATGLTGGSQSATPETIVEGRAAGFQGATPAGEATLPAGAGSTEVSATLTGLAPATVYHLRLLATNTEAQTVEAVAVSTFETKALAPLVFASTSTALSTTSAALLGYLNPRGFALTECTFQYGPTTAYGQSVPCESLAGPVNEVVPANATLTGLTPGATYHLRLVAASAGGLTAGPDVLLRPFAAPATGPCPNEAARTAQHAGFLPDCRAYELVSPPDKNGGDVMTNSQRTRAAADGSAVSFASLAGFGDVAGIGVSAEYMSERSTQADPGSNGWATHSITPPQSATPFPALSASFQPAYQGEFSPDLKSGVFSAYSPLTADPNVAEVANLYARHDLRTPGAGSYELATPCALCQETSTPLPPLVQGAYNGFPSLAGTSVDASHVLFESTLKLAPGATADTATGVTNVYESDNGVTHLVSLVPASGTECRGVECVPAPGSSIAGQGGGGGGAPSFYTPHAISSDGSRAFFTTEVTTCNLVPISYRCGSLYMRETGDAAARTVQINASERTDCATLSPSQPPKVPPACAGTPEPDPAGPQPAIYWDASVDGSRIFFSSVEKLTDDLATTGSNLYMYDINAPSGHHLTRISVRNPALSGGNPRFDAVLGASENGDYVYFADSRQLVLGQPTIPGGQEGIFLWHVGADTPPTGTLSYVGKLTNFTEADAHDNPISGNNWVLQPRQVRVTPDGRHLLFSATRGSGILGAHGGFDYDQGSCTDASNGSAPGCRELYIYDADTSQLKCATCNPTAATPTASAADIATANQGGTATSSYVNHALSADGRYVFFSTAEALLPADTNGRIDAYRYDTATGHLSLLSTGTSTGDSYFLDASADGRDAFIATRQSLVGWDTDRSYDLYDVRVGGGFPEPPQTPAACSADACHGNPPVPPPLPGAASAALLGPGNPKPNRKPPCKANQVRKHGRCVNKKHHPKKAPKRAAAHNRGGRK